MLEAGAEKLSLLGSEWLGTGPHEKHLASHAVGHSERWMSSC